MTNIIIEDQIDTAYLTAYLRGKASTLPDALLHDPFAQILAGERGEALARVYSQPAEVSGMALRTLIYDELLTQTIEQEQIDTVINLAASFDTRPYRLSLPASLRWIEADLPATIAYKCEKLATARAACQLAHYPLDVTDATARQAFLAEVCSQAQKVLVLTEGLLVYLSEEQVAELATDLAALNQIGWWLTELISPLTLQKKVRSWNTRVPASVQMRFSAPNGSEFFGQFGWQVETFRLALAEALRHDFPLPHKWLWRLLLRFGVPQQTDGFLLLTRSVAGSLVQ
jgi:methyltransferase (TIGR00027 family)